MAIFHSLLAILEESLLSHQALLKLSDEKRDALINGDATELRSITVREAAIIEKIQELEGRREQLVCDYLSLKGLNAESFTLDKIMEQEENLVMKEKLNRTAKKLRETIADLSRVNEHNQKLIHTSLSYLQYSIGLFARKEQTVGYGPNAVNRYSNLLDAKI
ncbi:flagellar protein FlgN [Bacillus sp. B-jedd]|uniref:flagellar protein FlgN n=1 Tax=Bacillus sp. B-jedd TaxID=1476857 RepID=UPI00051567BC|nr:flagellar protein FlgN [Bacillus sp. B-jedd]CEG25903.1 flagellar protein [Bacillus sp. B-jedd]